MENAKRQILDALSTHPFPLGERALGELAGVSKWDARKACKQLQRDGLIRRPDPVNAGRSRGNGWVLA